MSIYYDFSKIDGYQCPVKIVVSRRGLGKTFKKVKEFTEKAVLKGEKYVYIVETGDMVKELARDNGAKFWNAILEYYEERNTARKRYMYERLTDTVIDVEDDEMFENNVRQVKLIGGTLKVKGKTIGYIVDFNSFGELKRNNFNGIKNIFVDEFISEKMDKTTLDYPKRVSSMIQSIGRLRNINIFMAGNTVRIDDPVLSRMGFKIEKYGFYKKYDRYGLFAVLHFVDPADYPEFAVAHDKSVAGRFANLMGETYEEENKFLEDLPKNRRLDRFDYKKSGIHINLVRDDVIVTLRERENGTFACVPFSAGRASKLYCLNEREQGYKMGYMVIWTKNLRQMVLNLIRNDMIYYYSEIEYKQLKLIVQGGK